MSVVDLELYYLFSFFNGDDAVVANPLRSLSLLHSLHCLHVVNIVT